MSDLRTEIETWLRKFDGAPDRDSARNLVDGARLLRRVLPALARTERIETAARELAEFARKDARGHGLVLEIPLNLVSRLHDTVVTPAGEKTKWSQVDSWLGLPTPAEEGARPHE